MLRSLLQSKLHRATVSEADVDYVGSLSIDEDLMEMAGILENQEIHIADIDNGERLVTYAIRAPRGSRTFGVNGAAARKINIGDRIIVFAYSLFSDEELKNHVPKVVVLDETNTPIDVAQGQKNYAV